MTAKEYLQQYKLSDEKIKQLCEERQELHSRMYSITGVDTAMERVQQSKIANNKFIKYVELEEKIDVAIDNNYVLKYMIINQIHALENTMYIKILYMKYIRYEEYNTLGKIAVGLNYSYDRIKALHGYALKEFAEKHLQK